MESDPDNRGDEQQEKPITSPDKKSNGEGTTKEGGLTIDISFPPSEPEAPKKY
jgi:hypothetical protein